MKDYIVSALKPLVPYIPLLPKPVLSKLQYVPVLPAPVRAVAPYLPLLPTPLLTLGPTVAFHIASHSSPSPTAFFTASTTHPLHAPLLFLLSSIPFTYTLGLITNNVSWVDRWWPFYTPFCSFLLVLHMVYNEHAKVLTHNAPRAFLLFGLQLCWSIRLLSHARKRGFYDLTGEDYRYTQVRKIIPKWAFALLHLFVVAIAQPVLIFSLCLPVHAVMSMPPSELSAGPISALSIPFSSLIPFLPISRISAPPSTPILNLADLFLTALSVGLLYVEWTSDRQMYEFQESKHNAPKDTKRIHPGPFTPRSMFTGAPQPASFPVSHNPGFPTKSLWRYSRHPNFAAEQLFWFTQALFVVGAAESSGITRSGWVGGSVFGPAFAVSHSWDVTGRYVDEIAQPLVLWKYFPD
jgi:steroid 5-alpha reductase family enzyme